MSFLRSQRARGFAAVALVLAMFLIRPGAGRLRVRIISSISLALGRPVEVADVSLRLLPRPGFDLQRFVVHEDPAFGAEPVLRADEVTAALRLSSLLRGRLEIARLSLTEPSLNLVQNSSGHWNLENLLERAANTPVAPTSKGRIEARPGFPYIEADRARINLKLGQEKKPYALTNADFSLWQDSENAWGMRLKAEPMRTDFNLSDTGTIRVEGSWQRAAALRDTPLQFDAQWQRAQLGQVSKLAYGRDQGWRGEIEAFVTLKGTPAQLSIDSDAAIDDFRRYDLEDGSALPLTAHCSAVYSSVTRTLPSLSCQAPVSGGFVTLEGSVGVSTEWRNYDLVLAIQNVPAQSLVVFARHAKKGMPADLTASGTLDGNFKFQRTGTREGKLSWSGAGATRGLRLRSALAKVELNLDRVPVSMSTGPHSAYVASTLEMGEVPPRLEIGPISLPMGRPTAVLAHGQLSRSGYSMGIQGEAQIQRVLQLARALGLPSPQTAADGIAKVDLQVSGAWSAFAAPQTLGTAQLRSLRAEVRGLDEPLQVASANVFLAADQVDVKNLSASLAGSAWHGSLSLPRQCPVPGTCPVHFDLHADMIATDELGKLLSAGSRGQPWYRFLSSTPQPSVPYVRGLLASGNLSANRVIIHKLAASRVSANVELGAGVLRLLDLQADVLGGRHSGEWTADFSTKPPAYSGSGTFAKVALPQLAEATHDPWITGSADGTYHASASGWTLADLLSSANASLEMTAFNGTLPHLTLASGGGPLLLRRFDGRWVLRNSRLEIQEGKLDTPSGIYQLSGTASLGRVLDLKLTRNGMPSFVITGTVTQPHVAQPTAAETQAALKP